MLCRTGKTDVCEAHIANMRDYFLFKTDGALKMVYASSQKLVDSRLTWRPLGIDVEEVIGMVQNSVGRR